MGFDFNTSLMVRDALPDVIERVGKKNVRIFKYARVTRDTYDDVRRVSKEIWGGQRSLFLPKSSSDEIIHSPGPQSGEREETLDCSLILHLGMVALDWCPDQFRFETVARRDGYELPGADGKHVDSEELERLGLPNTLTTSFDIEAAWRRVKEKFPVSLSLIYVSSSTDCGCRMHPFSCPMMRVSTFASSVSTPLLQSRFCPNPSKRKAAEPCSSIYLRLTLLRLLH